MSSSVKIDVGFKGTVAGITRAEFEQRATISVKNSAGRVLTSTSLVGKGENSVPMTQEANSDLTDWSFGPFSQPMTIDVLFEHSQNGQNFSTSKAIAPITITKKPDSSSPQTFIVTTMLSEDSSDNDYNDCIISIFQYRPEAQGR